VQIKKVPAAERTDPGAAGGVRREAIMRLEKAQYNPSLKLAIDISRAVEAPIEELFVFD
jgi:DNA-binding XRE family transcriptional regulator